jgi:hypothetical protein
VTKSDAVLTDPILPSHAWMVGMVAEPDGNLIPPPQTDPDDEQARQDAEAEAPDSEADDR